MGQRKPVAFCKSLLLIGLLFGFSQESKAEVFRNSYLRFQLPEKWDCKLKGTVWTCRHSIPTNCKGAQVKAATCQKAIKKYKEAIIHLTAKETGPNDTLRAYFGHLKKPRTIVGKEKRRVKSKVIHLKKPKIKGQKWIDGMHLGSEIPKYYTRYLATVKGNVAVLVTFSSHKQNYSKYSSEFFETIKTMKVFSAPKSSPQLAKKSRANIKPGEIGPISEIEMDDADFAPEATETPTKKVPKLWMLLGGAALLILLAFVFLRKK